MISGIFKSEKKLILKDFIDIMERDVSHSSSYNLEFSSAGRKSSFNNGSKKGCFESKLKSKNKRENFKKNKMASFFSGIFKSEKKLILKDFIDTMERDVSHASSYNMEFSSASRKSSNECSNKILLPVEMEIEK